jgi:hypothetical protein
MENKARGLKKKKVSRGKEGRRERRKGKGGIEVGIR